MNFHDYMTFIGNEEDQKISAYALCILKNYVLNVRLRQRINCGLRIVSKVVIMKTPPSLIHDNLFLEI